MIYFDWVIPIDNFFHDIILGGYLKNEISQSMTYLKSEYEI